MPNETELAILSRLMRKILEIDPNHYGKKVVEFDFKAGNICGMLEVNGTKSINFGKLK